jgi:nicotinate-nucleotide adenylyltransferase
LPAYPPVRLPDSAKPLILIGGSFDPIHLGHLWMADQLQQQMPNADIGFLPTAGSPFKPQQSSLKHRLAQLRLALRDTPYHIERSELYRAAPTYTIDTLRLIRQRIGSIRPLVFVIGQDSLESLHQWKEYDQILHYTHLWVFPRGRERKPLQISDKLLQHQSSDAKPLKNSPHGLIYLASIAPPAISSTQIRQQFSHSRLLVPKRVWAYNQKSLLYGNSFSHES